MQLHAQTAMWWAVELGGGVMIAFIHTPFAFVDRYMNGKKVHFSTSRGSVDTTLWFLPPQLIDPCPFFLQKIKTLQTASRRLIYETLFTPETRVMPLRGRAAVTAYDVGGPPTINKIAFFSQFQVGLNIQSRMLPAALYSKPAGAALAPRNRWCVSEHSRSFSVWKTGKKIKLLRRSFACCTTTVRRSIDWSIRFAHVRNWVSQTGHFIGTGKQTKGRHAAESNEWRGHDNRVGFDDCAAIWRWDRGSRGESGRERYLSHTEDSYLHTQWAVDPLKGPRRVRGEK